MKRVVILLVLLVGASVATALTTSAQEAAIDPTLVRAMRYRNIGPHRGGRVTAVEGVPQKPFTFYMGGSGGVWRTTNAGLGWANVTDGFFEVGSIGAIDVADSDPNVIYVGTGSGCIRGNVSVGIGLYKSTDGARTWRHIGLRDIGQVGRIAVHPRNPDLVYVAATGHAFGATRSAASIAPRTAAPTGRKCSISTTGSARSTWRSTRATQDRSSQRCGRSNASPGR